MYAPVFAPIVASTPLSDWTAYVHAVVLSVAPINTLNVPPAEVMSPLDTREESIAPALLVGTTWAAFVKNVEIASEPSFTPKIVTESVASGLPLGVPSNNFTTTFTLAFEAGSSESAKVNVPVVFVAFSTPPTKNW